MDLPFSPHYTAADGSQLSQRQLDDLAVEILASASNLVREPVRVPGVEKRRPELGRRIKRLGPELLEHVSPPGSLFGQQLSGRLARYARGLASRRRAASSDLDALRAELNDPQSISDELAFAMRVLDRPGASLSDAHTVFAAVWLGSLAGRASRLSAAELTGRERKHGKVVTHLPYGSKTRYSRVHDMRDVVRLAVSGHNWIYRQTALGVWQLASALHDDLRREGGGLASVASWAMLGHFETWPDGLVDVLRVCSVRPGWRDRDTTWAFQVALGLDEAVDNDQTRFAELLARRCVHDSSLLTDVRWRHLGPYMANEREWARRGDDDRQAGEVLLLVEVVADATPLMERYEAGELAVPPRPNQLRVRD